MKRKRRTASGTERHTKSRYVSVPACTARGTEMRYGSATASMSQSIGSGTWPIKHSTVRSTNANNYGRIRFDITDYRRSPHTFYGVGYLHRQRFR